MVQQWREILVLLYKKCSLQGNSSSLSRLTQKVSGMVPSFRLDSPSGQGAADAEYHDDTSAKPRSKTLAKFRGKLFGNKKKQPPGTVDIPSGFDYQSSMSLQQVLPGYDQLCHLASAVIRGSVSCFQPSKAERTI
jgi:hypothetical protein